MAAPQLVVAALLVDDLRRPTRLLAARRTGPPALAGRWELPGGKVEPAEDPLTALRRELLEELGLGLVVGVELVPDIGTTWPLAPGLVMRTWWCTAVGEVTTSAVHDQLRWVGAGEASGLAWLPGDVAIIERVRLRLE